MVMPWHTADHRRSPLQLAMSADIDPGGMCVCVFDENACTQLHTSPLHHLHSVWPWFRPNRDELQSRGEQKKEARLTPPPRRNAS